MSEYIASFLQIQPSSKGTCCKILTDTSMQMNQEGSYPVVVDGVFKGPRETALCSVVAERALRVASEGKQAVCYVSGETGSDKTRLIRGMEGKMEDCLLFYFLNGITKDNSDANMCVLHVNGDNVQDLVSGARGLKVKIDEAVGAVISGATTIRITSVAEGKQHVDRCLSKRNEIFNFDLSSSESSSFLVFLLGFCGGRITIIESSGSESCLNAPNSVNEEVTTATQTKNEILKKIESFWIESATNADPKSISFRDSKIGLIIQPALSAAIEQNGYAAQVVCVKDSPDSIRGTSLMIDYCSACMKQESLKTVSEYKEIISHLEEMIEEHKKETPTLQNILKQAETSAISCKESIKSRFSEIKERSESFRISLQESEKEHDQKLHKLRDEYNDKKSQLAQKNEENIARMRNLSKNAPMQTASDIKKMKETVQVDHNGKLKTIQEEMREIKEEIHRIREKMEMLNKSRQKRRSEEAEAMKNIKPLENEIAKLRHAFSMVAEKKRDKGLSSDEIKSKQSLWDARDELDDLYGALERLAGETMQIGEIVKSEAGKPSDGSSDSESKSSNASYSLHETRAERVERMASEEQKQQEEQKRLEGEVAYNKEWKHFQKTIQKDSMLSDLLNKVLKYLEYGTNCTIVTPEGMERKFIYVIKGRKEIGLLVSDVEEGKVPQKKEAESIFSLDDISSIHMGQHSLNFQLQLRKIGGRVDPSRSDTPPEVEDMNLGNLHRFYYRSLSIQFGKNGSFLDFISDTWTDFEGWVVGLHRITGKFVAWGKRLFIDLAPKIDGLLPLERDFCEINHLLPVEYLKAKQIILDSNNRTFVTLQDLRKLCSIDLYHCQKLLELWMKQRWVMRRNLSYFKYQEQIYHKARNRQMSTDEETTDDYEDNSSSDSYDDSDTGTTNTDSES